MRFRVGPWQYTLSIEEQPLTHKGRQVMGICREASREIAISGQCPPHSRLKVLMHEIFHAWIFHTGEPNATEGWCDLFATAAVAAIDSLALNGGKEAVWRLQPGESPQPGAARLLLTRTRYCGKCQQTVAGGSVRCAAATTAGLLDMSLKCEHCCVTQHWQETMGINGLPTGIVVSGPVFTPLDDREEEEPMRVFLPDPDMVYTDQIADP